MKHQHQHLQRTCRSPRQSQEGIATLIVVLLLFFVVSMVAAYTNRNLIFEQRTSSNQYKSTQALEAAEAGLEWVLATLNLGRVDNSCAPSTNTSDLPLRQRLLSIDLTGRIRPTLGPSGEELTAVCVFNGSGWNCHCPSSGTASVTPPSGNGSFPAFRVRFQNVIGSFIAPTDPRQPGVVRAQVVGCTRADASGGDQCLQFNAGQGASGEGRVLISSLVALTGTATSFPQAALVARKRVEITGAGIWAVNSRAGGSGVTIQSGGTVSVANAAQLLTQPGSPPGMQTVIADDKTMDLPAFTGASAITTADRMFAAVFNHRPEVFRQQPAALELTCGIGGCSAAALRALVDVNPWRPIWIEGTLNLDSAGDVGTPALPALLIVNGAVNFSVSTATINGLLYVRTPAGSTAWTTNGGGKIVGATVADEEVLGNGTTTFAFDPAVMALIRWNTGSFVRVPGTWKDFE